MRYLEIEHEYISALTRMRTEPLTITFPINIPASFMENVSVVATAEQITNELVPYSGSSQQNCSICQESISSDGVELRGCHHTYHRECIQTWFGASVRCPVCRRDIREDSSTETSSGATGMPPPETYQWGGENNPE
jgi:hypothetical protein